MATVSAGQVFTFNYTGSSQAWFADKPCKVRMECWGAQGGHRGSDNGGKGGYVKGELTIKANETFTMFVGGYGYTGGYNGGGAGSYKTSPHNNSGGGASEITVKGTSNLCRILVGGGGGGCGASGKAGGYGGYPNGESRTENYGSGGGGGTQSAGGAGGTAGSFGPGGAGSNANGGYGGAGGGGWYGGGGVTPDSSGDDDRGGGGGSGYILTASSVKPAGYVPTSEFYFTNTGSTDNTSAGNGLIKVTILEVLEYVSSISVSAKTEYKKGDSFDTNGKVTLHYNTGNTSVVALTQNMTSGFDTSTTGEKTVTVTHSGFTTSYKINVYDITGIEITTPPISEYYFGDTFKSGGSIMVICDGKPNYTVVITGDMVVGFNTLVHGLQTVTIVYDVFSTSYEINVLPVELSISLLTQPKVEYFWYDSFENKGSLSVNMSDGTQKEMLIDSSMVVLFDTSKIGESVVVLQYKQFTLKYTINVIFEWIEPKLDWSIGDCLNCSDSNRIESNTEYLRLQFNQYYYNRDKLFQQAIMNRNYKSIEYYDSFNRFFMNVDNILKIFKIKPIGWIDIELNKFDNYSPIDFNDIKTLENNLNLVKKMFDGISSQWVYSGEINMGEGL